MPSDPHQAPKAYDEHGRLKVENASDLSPFYKEDIVFCGVPIGRMSYGYGRLSRSTLKALVSIGRFCSMADQVSIAGVNHPLAWVSSHPFLYRPDRGLITHPHPIPEAVLRKNGKVTIGHDVWIGEGARLLRSIKLGHGCVIAAGSIVTKDVPPYAIVAGCPARILKYRIPESIINDMLSIAWWDWPLNKIQDKIHDFYDPVQFVQKNKS